MSKLQFAQKLLQTLKITPQLQLSIKMLQMSRQELEDLIQKEMEQNPFLEEKSENLSEKEKESFLEGDSIHEGSGQTPEIEDFKTSLEGQEDRDWESYLESRMKGLSSQLGDAEDIQNMEAVISDRQDLRTYLRWQAHIMGLDEEEFIMACCIIDNINDDGYLESSIEEIAKSEGYALEKLEKVLSIIQELDPPGVGARDLKESLIIQAKQLEEDTPDLLRIITDHLPDVHAKNYSKIAKALKIAEAEVRYLVDIVEGFSPKPGVSISKATAFYVVPDVIVSKVGDSYVISLNDDSLSRVQISNELQKDKNSDNGSESLALKKREKIAQLNLKTLSSEERAFLKERYRSAKWLLKSLQNRQRTIFRVAEVIVRRQIEFFEKGPEGLKPLILKDVAQELGIHESTVSRVTNNKYMLTPIGIYELKFFFQSSIRGQASEDVVGEALKQRIQQLIASEDPRFPLSDQEITDKLKILGVDLARRTVAKYREAIKIPSASARKKQYRSQNA